MLGVCLLTMTVPPGLAQAAPLGDTKATVTRAWQDIVSLSKDKWRWMAERKVDSLAALFRAKRFLSTWAATCPSPQELDVIKSGGIQYKEAQIQETSVADHRLHRDPLSRLRLVAVVGGNEVTNPFVVTEVYVKQAGAWKLASLSFTRLRRTRR